MRQRDGFGCVLCGNAIVDYEHFDPEFSDAKSHDVDGIILLCIQCHGLKTRGRLSRETIHQAMRNPKARQLGFSFGPFDVGNEPPEIIVGDITARNVPVVLRVDGENIMQIQPPEEAGGPFRISAFVCDRAGRSILHIIENEWRTRMSNWDVVTEGPVIVIRSAIRDIDLRLRTNPPRQLIFERFIIRHRGIAIECRESSSTTIEHRDGTKFSTTGTILDGCQVGIDISDGGIAIGVGGGSVQIKSMAVNPTEDYPKSKAHGNIIAFPSKQR